MYLFLSLNIDGILFFRLNERINHLLNSYMAISFLLFYLCIFSKFFLNGVILHYSIQLLYWNMKSNQRCILDFLEKGTFVGL